MSSKGKRRSNSSKPALPSEAQQYDEGLSPSVAESSPEPVPAQDTMDQSSKSMVSIPSSSDHSSPSDTKPLETSADSASPESSASSTDQASSSQSTSSELTTHTQPIPPASEPTQYRAIGLIKAKYVPSAKQFSRGQLVTDDECTFNAVLLGRVMSLVKKHLDPESNHLWVVYPRTREKTCDLHVQVVGVWEPETLDRNPEDMGDSEDETIAPEEESVTSAKTAQDSTDDAVISSSEAETTPPKAPMPPKPPATSAATKKAVEYVPLDAPTSPEDGYFSIRGEVVNLAQNPDRVTIKIQQSPRKGEEEGRSFRIMLMGSLEGRTLGHFWELNVRRQGLDLVIEDGQRICVVQPRKPPKGGRPISRGQGPSAKSLPRRAGSSRPMPRPVSSSSSESPAEQKEPPSPKTSESSESED